MVNDEEVLRLRTALAAAEVALTTAQNDLDAAGTEIARLRAERDQARAEKHGANNLAQAVVGSNEAAIRRIRTWDEYEARLASEDLERALRSKSSAPPAADSRVRLGPDEVP